MSPLSNKRLLKCVSLDRSLSVITKTNYAARLTSMASMRGMTIYNIIRQSKASLLWIKNTYKETCSRQALVTSVQALIKRSPVLQKALTAEALSNWKLGSRELSAMTAKRYSSNIPSARQAAAFVSFPEVCRMRDSLSVNSLDRLLLSFYTMTPPCRGDLNAVRILVKKRCPKLTQIKDANFLWLPKDPTKAAKVVLREHKTSKHILGAPLTKVLPKELSDLVRQSLKFSKRSYLFTSSTGLPYSAASFSKSCSRRLQKLWPNVVNPSVTMLRHSFISHFCGKGNTLTSEQKEWLAAQSGHSVALQAQYVFDSQTLNAVQQKTQLVGDRYSKVRRQNPPASRTGRSPLELELGSSKTPTPLPTQLTIQLV